MAQLKADGAIIDYRVDFPREQNTAAEMRQGKVTIGFKAEEAPVLKYIGVRSARFYDAFDGLLDDLLAEVAA